MNNSGQTKWFRSKTVWFNVIMTALLLVDGLQVLKLVPVEYLTVITLFGNVVLRVWFTGSPIQKT